LATPEKDPEVSLATVSIGAWYRLEDIEARVPSCSTPGPTLQPPARCRHAGKCPRGESAAFAGRGLTRLL